MCSANHSIKPLDEQISFKISAHIKWRKAMLCIFYLMGIFIVIVGKSVNKFSDTSLKFCSVYRFAGKNVLIGSTNSLDINNTGYKLFIQD